MSGFRYQLENIVFNEKLQKIFKEGLEEMDKNPEKYETWKMVDGELVITKPSR